MMKSFLISLMSIAFVAGCSNQKSRSNQIQGKTPQKTQAPDQGQGQPKRDIKDLQAGGQPASTQTIDQMAPSNEKSDTGNAATANKAIEGVADASAVVGSLPPPAKVTLPPATATQAPAPEAKPAAAPQAQAPETKPAVAPAAPQAQSTTQQAEVKPAANAEKGEQKTKPVVEEKKADEPPAPAEKVAGETKYGPEYLNYIEYFTATSFLKGVYKENYNAVRALVGADGAFLQTKIDGSLIKIRLVQNEHVLAEINEFGLDTPDHMLMGENNSYKFAVGCFDAQCELVFVNFIKVSDEQVELNLLKVLKKVDGQYVQAKEKSKEDYAKERAELEAEAKKSGDSK